MKNKTKLCFESAPHSSEIRQHPPRKTSCRPWHYFTGLIRKGAQAPTKSLITKFSRMSCKYLGDWKARRQEGRLWRGKKKKKIMDEESGRGGVER